MNEDQALRPLGVGVRSQHRHGSLRGICSRTGRAACERWLEAHFSDLGERSTVDLRAMFAWRRRQEGRSRGLNAVQGWRFHLSLVTPRDTLWMRPNRRFAHARRRRDFGGWSRRRAAIVRLEFAGPSGPPDLRESFMPMPTLSTAVLQRSTTRGTIVVDMGIDIPDAALRARAQANQPRLRDALRTALSTYAGTYYRDRTAPDPTTLARLMQSAVDRTLGASGARVLFTNIIYQR